jgi:hypothetical protein
MTSMPQVGFEPTISVFEWAKTANVLDREATLIGRSGAIAVTIRQVDGWASEPVRKLWRREQSFAPAGN